MFLIAGLGNPGQKYAGTRHNIGFMVTGNLAEKHDIRGIFQSKFNAIVGKGRINDAEVLIVQPQTYMNLSGQAVQAALHWYKIDVKKLFVIYDDISLDFGRIRFRPSGTAGSHNGIKSIISYCGTENFARLKVGIGPNPGEHLWSSYVLQQFSVSEKKDLPKIIETCTECVEFYLKEGINSAMNKYNGLDVLE